NTVGSGDSTVAGFAYGISQNLSIEKSMRLALSCGTSNAMLESTGDIDLKMISKLENEIKIDKIAR
ncbi:MAG: PfkB family carbohydrate kinase, partial [Mycoplasmatales bacterium]